jgi:hypothetical protein
MTLGTFQNLAFEDQVTAVWAHGRHIATRYEEEDTVGLYLMESGFFVELFYDEIANHMVERTRPFPADDLDSLEDYAAYVRLDDLTRP